MKDSIKSSQYNVVVSIAGAIRSTSTEKPYQKL